MKRVMILCVLTMIFSSCTSFVKYDLSLSEVDGYNKKNITDKLKFEDSFIMVSFTPGHDRVRFVIKNKTDKTISVLWDKAAFVNISEEAQRVIHSGIRLINKAEEQIPSVIPKGKILKDVFAPTENIVINLGHGATLTHRALIPNQMPSPKKVKEMAESFIGKDVAILLPITIGKATKEYLFSFNIDGYKLCPTGLLNCK